MQQPCRVVSSTKLHFAVVSLWCCFQERGAFTLVLSGGSLLKAVGQLVGAPGVDFSKWHVFFVDERNVPHSHSDSNFKGADEALLSKVRCCIEDIRCTVASRIQ